MTSEAVMLATGTSVLCFAAFMASTISYARCGTGAATWIWSSTYTSTNPLSPQTVLRAQARTMTNSAVLAIWCISSPAACNRVYLAQKRAKCQQFLDSINVQEGVHAVVSAAVARL
nr:hypothetical protein CFP56_12976 [Quercus suber]